MAFLHKLPPIQNVGASQTGVLPAFPLGMTYLATVFAIAGTTATKALMTNIRQYINGKMHVNVTGAHLDTMNQHKRMTADAAFLSLNYAAREARTITGVQIGAIDTSVGVDVMSMEIDFGAISGDATYRAWALLAPPKLIGDPNKRTIRALLKSTHAPAAAGEYTLPIPMGSKLGGSIKTVGYFHTGHITKVQVLKDGAYLQQEGEVALVNFVQGERNRTTQANYVAWDPAFMDNQSESIDTVRRDAAGVPVSPATFEHRVTLDAADTIIAYTDMYTSVVLI